MQVALQVCPANPAGVILSLPCKERRREAGCCNLVQSVRPQGLVLFDVARLWGLGFLGWVGCYEGLSLEHVTWLQFGAMPDSAGLL